MSKSRSLFEFYKPQSRVNKPGDSSHCDEHAGASSQTESPEADSDSDEDSAVNGGVTASRDSSLMEQSPEQDDDICHQSLDLLQELIRQSRILTDLKKYQLLTSVQEGLTDGDLDTRYFSATGGRKRKQITFQKRWLQDYKWLRYGVDKNYQGGCCLPCILFLSGSEKESLGAFACTPFTNYNKSKELCERHAMPRSIICVQWIVPMILSGAYQILL